MRRTSKRLARMTYRPGEEVRATVFALNSLRAGAQIAGRRAEIQLAHADKQRR